MAPIARTPGTWRWQVAEDGDRKVGVVYALAQDAQNPTLYRREHIATIRTPAKKFDTPLIAAAPELQAELESLVARCDGEEGVRADGSNIQTVSAHALLARLREEA